MRVDLRTAARLAIGAIVFVVAVLVIFRPLGAPRAQQVSAQQDTVAFTAPEI